MLKFQPINLNDRTLVIGSGGEFLGDICNDLSGFVFTCSAAQGMTLKADELRAIADKIDALNHELDVQAQIEMDAQETE